MRSIGQTTRQFVDELVKEGKIRATDGELCLAIIDSIKKDPRQVVIVGRRTISILDAVEELFDSLEPIEAGDRLAALADDRSRRTGALYSEAFREIQSEEPALVREHLRNLTRVERDPVQEAAKKEFLDLAMMRAPGRGASYSELKEAFIEVSRSYPVLARTSLGL